MERRWNHNIRYHSILLDAVPRNAAVVLDAGCGVGTLTQSLRSKAHKVVGIDLDAAGLALARSTATGGIEYVCGDFLDHPFAPESFDAVLSVATLHHMDATAGLRRMRELVRPGGVVGVIGLARNDSLVDYAAGGVGLAASWAYRAVKGYWEHPSPQVWPPPETWESMRRIALRELPGCRFRRHLLWRYSLLWTKPRQPVYSARSDNTLRGA